MRRVALLLLAGCAHTSTTAADDGDPNRLRVEATGSAVKRRFTAGPADVTTVHCVGPLADETGHGLSFLFLGDVRDGTDADCQEPDVVKGKVRTPATVLATDVPVHVSFDVPAGKVGCAVVAPGTACTIRWKPGQR